MNWTVGDRTRSYLLSLAVLAAVATMGAVCVVSYLGFQSRWFSHAVGAVYLPTLKTYGVGFGTAGIVSAVGIGVSVTVRYLRGESA